MKPDAPIQIALLGATGRMGRALLALLAEAPEAHLSGALTSPGNAALGEDAGAAIGWKSGVTMCDDPRQALAGADVAIDFTLPAAAGLVLEACSDAGCPLVTGVTGHDAEALQQFVAAAERIAIVRAPNMSVGVAVVRRMVELAASALGPAYDAEVIETHHRDKRDAPSGTALHLGAAIAGARGQSLEDVASYRVAGADQARKPGEIGFASIRAGEIVGEHTVLLAGAGERVEISHRALTRATFAAGALRAAVWVCGRAPGSYGMEHVLGLED